MLDIVIIGAGPVGLYASTLASLHNLKGVVLESRDLIGGQLSNLYPQKEVVDIPGFKSITAEDFVSALLNQNNERANRLDIKVNETVLSCEKSEQGYLVKTDSNEYETRTVLIATGMGKATPRTMGLENEEKYSNIFYSVKDKYIFKDKDVVIMGGGDSAVDEAIMLQPIAKSVKIVHRRNEFRAQSCSVTLMKDQGVETFVPYSGKKLIGSDDKVIKLILKNMEDDSKEIEIETDAIIVSYGMVAAKNNFEIDKFGQDIKVFETYMTSKENVFAIGNAINYPGKVKNITCGLGEAVVAITKIDQIINPGKNIPVHF